MELLILMAVAVLVIMLASNYGKEATHVDRSNSKIFKVCPPHKWRWVEIKDEDGSVAGHYINCERCGPLRNPGEEV